MNLAIAALLVLAGAWFVLRTGGQTAPQEHGVWIGSKSRRQTLLGMILIVAASVPLLLVTWPFSGFPPLAPGDAHTHATIAQAIVNRGLPHGWIDAYQGGFPLGPHYPFVGWMLTAAVIKLGAPAPHAVLWIGTAFLLAVPLLAWALALRAGSRFLPAIVGALCLAWLSPANGFVGGWEAYWGKGVLSQIVALPFVVCLVYAVAARAPAGLITTAAVAAMASHPQVTMASLIVLFVAVAASWDAGAARRYIRALLSAGLMGAVLFAPGIATLRVPFGWPPMDHYLVIGYSPDRLGQWIVDGDLLDLDRMPVLTTLWAGALLVALLRVRRPAARAVLLGSLATLAFMVSGGLLEKAGAFGQFLLGFVQPLRFTSVVPIAMAASIVVAMEEAAPYVLHVANAVCRRPLPFWSWRAAQAAAIAALALLAVPSRMSWAREVRDAAKGGFFASGCEAFDGEKIAQHLRTLRLGRVWYDDGLHGGMGNCSLGSGFEYESAVPMAVTRGAGAHVGVHSEAFHALVPGQADDAKHAEALGVRYLLLKSQVRLDEQRWTVVAETEGIRLWERRGGTDSVGVGCVDELWEGSDSALRSRLFQVLRSQHDASRMLSPTSFVELREGPGLIRESMVPAQGCEPRGAGVVEIPREPGSFEARVEATSNVDVVFRAAAFPTWKVTVDGERVPTRKVGPGFFAARVGPGNHRVVATVSSIPGYWVAVLLAVLGCVASTVPATTWRRWFSLVVPQGLRPERRREGA